MRLMLLCIIVGPIARKRSQSKYKASTEAVFLGRPLSDGPGDIFYGHEGPGKIFRAWMGLGV